MREDSKLRFLFRRTNRNTQKGDGETSTHRVYLTAYRLTTWNRFSQDAFQLHTQFELWPTMHLNFSLLFFWNHRQSTCMLSCGNLVVELKLSQIQCASQRSIKKTVCISKDVLSSYFYFANLRLQETTPELNSLNCCQNFTINRSHIHTHTYTDQAPLPFDDILKLVLFNQMRHGVQVLKTLFFFPPIFRRLLLLGKRIPWITLASHPWTFLTL